jgi:protein-L-isoaspartate(D-aspartate) O-methyltransferase
MPFLFASALRSRLAAVAGSLGLAVGSVVASSAADGYASPRRQMLVEIGRIAHETRTETGRPVFAGRVMAALEKVPRHRFVAAGQEDGAYQNRPLAIGQGQTISQPYIVALMTELADLEDSDRVLEIGTGSGYQAAVLAELVAEVYTIEIIEPLAREAARRLAAAGYRNVTTRVGDGYRGWAERGPFDAIVVTAAAPSIPPALVEQLKPGGRLVIPVGAQDGEQTLYRLHKQADGKVMSQAVLAVRFVPFTRALR